MKKIIFYLLILALAGALYAQNAYLINEDFESTPAVPIIGEGLLPDGWFGSMSVQQELFAENNKALHGQITQFWPTQNATTPLIGPIVPGTNLTFRYRITEGYSYTPIALQANTFEVKVGAQEIHLISGHNHPATVDWIPVTVNLNGFIGQTIKLNLIATLVQGPLFVIEIDDVQVCYQAVDNDLSAHSVVGPLLPTVNSPTLYTVRVDNMGLLPADDYTISLYEVVDDDDDIVIDTQVGVPIAIGGRHTFSFYWTPPQVGATKIYAEITYLLDEQTINNKTPDLEVDVLTAGSFAMSIGDPLSSLVEHRVPFNVWFVSNISQAIYLEEEIGDIGGEITHIGYTFTGMGDMTYARRFPIRIWMGVTDQTSFPTQNDWVPTQQLTLVYEGEFYAPFEDTRDILFELDTPFNYGGGNLVIMCNRRYYQRHFNHNNVFLQTATPGVNRMMNINDNFDANVDDLFDGYNNVWNEQFQMYPNLKLVMQTEGFGILSGTVTYQGQPLPSVTIRIDGTPRQTLTNAQGEYIMSHVAPGNISVTASKLGYHNATVSNVLIEPEQRSYANFTMTALPIITVSGTVVRADTGATIPDAIVRLSGYAPFETTTNASGVFEIPNVYGQNSYTLTVLKSGYLRYESDPIEFPATDYDFETIILSEFPYPPQNVFVEINDTQAIITWDEPDNVSNAWFSHSSNDFLTNYLGTNTPYKVAHRYTPAHLSTLGVTGATLSKIAVTALRNPAVTYTIEIYNSSNGSNPGNLVHTQTVAGNSVNDEAYTEITLTTPVAIPNSDDLWIVIAVSAGVAVIGVDSGPPTNWYGNLIYIDGEWTSLLQEHYSLDFNWMIKGYAQGVLRTIELVGADSVRPVGQAYMLGNDDPPSLPPLQMGAKTRLALSKNEGKASLTPTKRAMGNTNIIRAGSEDGQYKTNNNSGSLTIVPSMIKGGQSTPSPYKSNRVLLGYDIYRANINAPNQWTTIVENYQDGYQYFDDTWADLSSGQYRYSIRARYTDNILSERAISNIVDKDMEVTVNINITTSNGYPPLDAEVIMSSVAGRVYREIAFDNIVTFRNVWCDDYTLTIRMNSYYTFTATITVNTDPSNHDAELIYANYIFVEDFEGSEHPPIGWTMIDADGDGWDWMYVDDREQPFTYAYEGFRCLASESWDGIIYNIPLFPDNYLISPRIDLPTNSDDIRLSYFIATADEWFPIETYSVMISMATTPTVESFINIYTETLDASNAQYQERTHDLTDYAGLSMFIAFRHHDSTENLGIKLDYVTVSAAPRPENETDSIVKPFVTSLKGNYPNPFNPETTIQWVVGADSVRPPESRVTIDIYNIKGQKVKSLVNDVYPPGNYSVQWNGKDNNDRPVSSGIYFYRMTTDEYTATRKMILMK